MGEPVSLTNDTGDRWAREIDRPETMKPPRDLRGGFATLDRRLRRQGVGMGVRVVVVCARSIPRLFSW
jgi:hypothetical protein